MAVFLLNNCKFNGCGLDFSTLQELIYHIEDTHLDFEPKNIEEIEFKQTSCMPISYIFRLFSGEYNQTSIKSNPCNSNLNVTINSRKDSGNHKTKFPLSLVSSICSTTPTGSEVDEENYESESEKSSIDSWSNNSIESDSNSILKIINPITTVVTKDDSDKPYICQFSNCKKRYRNSNGLKYHTKSVHTECGIKKELTVPKLYKCHCDKNYKTPYGLKNHAKTCSVNLSNSNPIGKISEIKVNLNAKDAFNSFNQTKLVVTPQINFKISSATSSPSSNLTQLTIQEKKNINGNLSLDESMHNTHIISKNDLEIIKTIKKEDNLSPVKTSTLQQHLLSPIETKSSIKTSQS